MARKCNRCGVNDVYRVETCMVCTGKSMYIPKPVKRQMDPITVEMVREERARGVTDSYTYPNTYTMV